MTSPPLSLNSPAPTRGRWVVALAVLAGLAVGFVAAFLLSGRDAAPAPAPVAAAADTRDGDPDATAELPAVDALISPADATDPETALRGFLAAEATGEWAASYGFLAGPARDLAYPSEALWINAHADFPTVTGYRIDEVVVGENGTATAQTLTGFDPVLDPVLGLVAARGASTWTLVEEDGLWRVEATLTENRPLYPSADGADVAAQQWVDTRLTCGDTAALEADMVGSPGVANRLCDDPQPGEVTVGEPRSLADSDGVTPLLSEFGPEVYAWSRVVDVTADTPFRLVLGPVGGTWQIVGVLPRA